MKAKNKPRSLHRYLLHFDYLLLIFVLVTTAFGLVVLDGATHDVPGVSGKALDQAHWWVVSIIVFAIALTVPYRWLRYLGWPLYAFMLVLLLLLAISAQTGADFGGLAVRRGGAVSWFRMPGVGVLVQPAEFAKISLVIVLAHWLAWREDKLRSVFECVPPLILTGIPIAFLLLQPDLGTAVVFAPLPFILLFVGGLNWRVVLSLIIAGIISLAGGLWYLTTAESIPFLRPHQVKRIQAFSEPLRDAVRPLLKPFNPPGVEEVLFGENQIQHEEPKAKRPRVDTWQIDQGEMALGSGRLFGKGWRQGKLSRYRFLPDHWTDFIFASLGEQFGFVGCLTLLGLYLLIAWRVVHVAILATDPFGKNLAIGLISVFMLHVYFNIGMSIKLLPTTGLPLPLISYGGSFLATNYLIFGLIANVGMRRKTRRDLRED